MLWKVKMFKLKENLRPAPLFSELEEQKFGLTDTVQPGINFFVKLSLP
jgi:hypothetical protein